MGVGIERINPPGLSSRRARFYSHYVKVTRPLAMLFISGQVSRDLNGNTVGIGDIEIQFRQVMSNLSLILERERATLSSLVKIVIYVTDARHFEKLDALRASLFPDEVPACTFLEVSKLAQPDLLIEIDAIAALGHEQ